MKETRTPWLNNYGDVPFNLDYHTGTMFDMVNEVAEKLLTVTFVRLLTYFHLPFTYVIKYIIIIVHMHIFFLAF